MTQILVLINHSENGIVKGTKMLTDKLTQAVAEAYKKMKQEELKGDQHKIDANKNGQIDSHDFKILRGQKNEETELEPGQGSHLNLGGARVKNTRSDVLAHVKKTFPNAKDIKKTQYGWGPKHNSVDEAMEETEPKSEKEKNLAALGHPKDKITHKDVLIGRGVIKKEEWDSKKPTVSEAVEEPTGDLKKACWKGYTAVGLKKKGGRMVPNCVPEELELEEKKETVPFKGPYDKPAKKQPGQKSDPGFSTVRHLARQAMQKMIDKTKKEEVELQEGKMAQLHADIEDAVGQHVKAYNAGKLGHDSFGEKVVAAHEKISKLHGIKPEHAKKFVNDYVDQHMKEEVELTEGNDDVGEMIKDKLKIIINRAKEMHDGIGPNTDMPEWVKSKITLAQDYVSTACDYSCGSEQLGEDVNEGLVGAIAKGVAINVLGKMAANALTKKDDKKEKDQVDERCWDGYKPVEGKEAYSKGSCTKEEVEIQEGRASQRHPLEGHDYHKMSHVELRGIMKDAGEAKQKAREMGNEKGENKYADQVNDAATVLHWRKQNGTPEWYQKKYGHMKNEEVEIQEDMGEPDIKVRSTYTKAYADHYKRALRMTPKGASKRAQIMAYDTVKAKHGEEATDALRAFHDKNQNEGYQLDEELSSRAKLVKELFNKAKEKKSKKDVFEADPEMEVMPSPQYSQQKNK